MCGNSKEVRNGTSAQALELKSIDRVEVGFDVYYEVKLISILCFRQQSGSYQLKVKEFINQLPGPR